MQHNTEREQKVAQSLQCHNYATRFLNFEQISVHFQDATKVCSFISLPLSSIDYLTLILANCLFLGY